MFKLRSTRKIPSQFNSIKWKIIIFKIFKRKSERNNEYGPVKNLPDADTWQRNYNSDLPTLATVTSFVREKWRQAAARPGPYSNIHRHVVLYLVHTVTKFSLPILWIGFPHGTIRWAHQAHNSSLFFSHTFF